MSGVPLSRRQLVARAGLRGAIAGAGALVVAGQRAIARRPTLPLAMLLAAGG